MFLKSKAGFVVAACALCILRVLGWAAAAKEWLSCMAVHTTLPFAAAGQGVDECEPDRCWLRDDSSQDSTAEAPVHRKQWPAVPLQAIVTTARA